MLIAYKGGGFTYCLPLREADHDHAMDLLFTLQSTWIESQRSLSSDEATIAVVKQFFPLIRSICLMTPTLPGLEWQFDKLQDEFDLVESLFLHPDGPFLKLHEFEVKESAEKEKPFGVDSLSFPASGNDRADRVASYLHGTEWGPTQVEKLFKFLSREELSGVVWVLQQLANPEDRMEAEKANIMAEYDLDFDAISAAIALGRTDELGDIDIQKY